MYFYYNLITVCYGVPILVIQCTSRIHYLTFPGIFSLHLHISSKIDIEFHSSWIKFKYIFDIEYWNLKIISQQDFFSREECVPLEQSIIMTKSTSWLTKMVCMCITEWCRWSYTHTVPLDLKHSFFGKFNCNVQYINIFFFFYSLGFRRIKSIVMVKNLSWTIAFT